MALPSSVSLVAIGTSSKAFCHPVGTYAIFYKNHKRLWLCFLKVYGCEILHLHYRCPSISTSRLALLFIKLTKVLALPRIHFLTYKHRYRRKYCPNTILLPLLSRCNGISNFIACNALCHLGQNFPNETNNRL